uniref:non-specific serine/threonine protein kinase n=1 Tax=Prolemur simus TaxID=1328070 RepID=A0A8C8YGI0_PROSS
MRALNHPNILKLLNVIEDEDNLCLIMEYTSGGDLSGLIRSRQRLSEEEARPIFCQLLAAVQSCHENHIVHRDLKPNNVLLDEHGNVKLADFGLAGTFSEGGYLDIFCGTPVFSAPEMFLREKYVGPEVDVWSLAGGLQTHPGHSRVSCSTAWSPGDERAPPPPTGPLCSPVWIFFMLNSPVSGHPVLLSLKSIPVSQPFSNAYFFVCLFICFVFLCHHTLQSKYGRFKYI